MHNHKHEHCQHENLKYCHHCEIVYCLNCGKEWGNYSFTYTTPYRWVYQGIPYTVTWGNTGNYTISNSSGMKVTDSYIVNAFQNSTEYRDTVGCKTACTHN